MIQLRDIDKRYGRNLKEFKLPKAPKKPSSALCNSLAEDDYLLRRAEAYMQLLDSKRIEFKEWRRQEITEKLMLSRKRRARIEKRSLDAKDRKLACKVRLKFDLHTRVI